MEHFRYFEKLGIPGPKPSFFFGNMWQIYRRGHVWMQKEWYDKYGAVVGYFYGEHPVFLIADVDLLKQLQLKDFRFL